MEGKFKAIYPSIPNEPITGKQATSQAISQDASQTSVR